MVKKLPLGVTGNTPDSGSGESWFEPRRGNLKAARPRPAAFFVAPSALLAPRCASATSPGGATRSAMRISSVSRFVLSDPDAAFMRQFLTDRRPSADHSHRPLQKGLQRNVLPLGSGSASTARKLPWSASTGVSATAAPNALREWCIEDTNVNVPVVHKKLIKSPCRWMPSTRLRHERSRFGTTIRACSMCVAREVIGDLPIEHPGLGAT